MMLRSLWAWSPAVYFRNVHEYCHNLGPSGCWRSLVASAIRTQQILANSFCALAMARQPDQQLELRPVEHQVSRKMRVDGRHGCGLL